MTCYALVCSCLSFALLGACGGDLSAAQADLAATPIDKATACASTFGSGLTNAFGRLDGTLRAIVPPDDDDCAMPNSDHIVVQLDAGGATYRMVVNVLSDQGSPDVLSFAVDAPLAGVAFAPGWHEAQALDYVTTLAVHSTSFSAHTEAELTTSITDALTVGADVSVYATSSGGASAHLVHRNVQGEDGAIVLYPAGSARYLLFRFDEQTF